MNTKILPILVSFLLIPGLAMAQQGTVSGTVVDSESGQTLPGASVQIPAVGAGTATNADGEFSFRVESGEYQLSVSFVGYQEATREVTVTAGATTSLRIQLEPSEQQLGEVVVTGVSSGTATEELGFTVEKVDEQELQAVPGTDPANALRGKTAGARIVQGSGQPGTAPDIRLRGTTTLSGSQEPLLVVDGAITSGGLEDIDMQSVRSIEIIKGAAAASQYGSLAANGVIQVITDRGEGNTEGDTKVTVRNEFGFTQLPGDQIDVSKHHNKDASKADPDAEEGAFRVTCDGPAPCSPGPEADDNVFDNDYSQVFNQQDQVYDPGTFSTNYVSVSSRQGGLNYLISFENQRNEQLVKGWDPYTRRNLRLNVDNEVRENLELSGSFLYSRNQGADFLENGQFADSPFYGALLAFPDLDLDAPPPEGSEAAEQGVTVNPYARGGNAANPLYRSQVSDRDFSGDRLFANLKADWDLFDFLSLEGQFSWDEDQSRFRITEEAGAISADPDDAPSPGSVFEQETNERLYTVRGKALFTQNFGDLEMNLTGRYQYEDREIDFFNLNGEDFLVEDIQQFDNTDTDRLDPAQSIQTIRSQDLVGSLVLDYDDTYRVDGVLRRETVSLFGPEARDKVYFRLSGSYRLHNDISIPNVQQFKLRGSYGTAGSRPPFEAQYETFTVTQTGITKETLGNENIQPADVQNLEVGLDAYFLDRFSFTGTYSESSAEDQVLEVPLPGPAGFNSQYRNAATIETNTFELALNGDILRTEDYGVNFGVTFSRTRQEVTELDRSAFQQNVGSQIDLFRIQEGVQIGSIFGTEFATSIGDLRFDDQGCLIGETPDLNNDGCLEQSDLMVNDDGYVIEEGTQYADGTDDYRETPFPIRTENGAVESRKIGSSIPDFIVGFNTTVDYNNWTASATLDWEQGADVYNYTKQLLYFNERHGDLDQSDKPEEKRRGASYYFELYNGSTSSSHFVEDGSFMKLREVSLSYRFSSEFFDNIGLGNAVRDAKISVLGRNLLTFTSYDGYDPEVSTDTADQPSNYKVDDFAYPNFRTYSASFELRF